MDPTVIRKDDNTLTINVEGEGYEGCTLISCGHPIGRRTVVFQSRKPSAPVIKEQYLLCPITAAEAEIPETIILGVAHEDGEAEIPSVVRVLWSGYVERADGISIECGTGGRRRQ